MRLFEFNRVDAIEAMGDMEGETIDVIVTSPPYNQGKDYGPCKDSMKHSEYLIWTRSWAMTARNALSDDGSLFLNISGKPSDHWLPLQVATLFGDLFRLQNVFHWVKSISLDDGPCRGHVKPINSERFVNDAHEYVFHFTKSGCVPLNKLAIGVPFADESNLNRGNRGKNGNVRDQGNCWFIPYPTRNSSAPHPAEFPVELPLRCLKLHGVTKDSVVLDPFCGTGATGLAAASLGAHFVGFDLNGDYLQEAKRRCEVAGYPAVACL